MHLHIPDGVLPPLAWGPGLALALLLLVLGARLGRRSAPAPGYAAALGALMLAAMVVEIPLGPLEYHLTLVGPVGVLLGPAASFQVVFIVNLILALLGHGGLTVVGLNSLVLGAGAALARPLYVRFARRLAAPPSLAAATAIAHAVAGALWFAVVVAALRAGGAAPMGMGARTGILAGLAFPMALVGMGIESAVAWGTARFLARVRPDLLPGAATAEAR